MCPVTGGSTVKSLTARNFLITNISYLNITGKKLSTSSVTSVTSATLLQLEGLSQVQKGEEMKTFIPSMCLLQVNSVMFLVKDKVVYRYH